MKKGLFTAAVIAAMMMTQPVMAQEVVEQTGEVVQQTEEDVSEPDMAADYQMETDLAAEINVFSADNNETPIVSADPTGQEGDKDAEEGDKEPEIKTGWQTEEGKTYYYDEKGNKSVGEKKIDGKWYLFDYKTGVMQTGMVKLSKKTVYYGADGAMRYGEQKINGKWYYFHMRTGAMQTGLQTVPLKNGGTKTVYYGTDGTMRYGEQKIKGKWYYFQQGTGAMQIGFAKVSGKTVYYGEDGAMRYEHQLIDGDYYYFHPKTGAMQTGLLDFGGDRWGFYGTDGKQIPMIDAKTAIDAAHEFFKETISDENLEIIKGHYVQYLAAEPEMVDGHSNPQYYIYAIVTEDDADFDENTDEDDVIYGDVIRVDAVTKECVYDTDVSGID